ncbi:response regulator [Paenibacillus sp. OT2-17]|nr:ATP-binding protein [Paenibacillus sp. OT2-17]MXO79587.1 response regulator [Paenibacillus sp. OT2-17]
MRFQREILFHYRSHFSFITMLALPISFLVLLWMAYGSYMDGERTVIEQQQQQLLTIAKLNSTSIESFFDEQMHTMQILAGNRQMSLAIANKNEAMIDENLSAYYTAKKNSIYRISQVNPEGRVVHTFPKRNRADAIKAYELIKDDIQRVLREKKPFIASAKLEKQGNYIVHLFQPVYLDGKFQGALISVVNLNAVYEKLLKPIRVGTKGYIHVKDQQGYYLMHPSEENIGLSLSAMKAKYPGLDYHDLEKLFKMQLTQEQGSAFYHSYWWGDKFYAKTKKIEAFSRVHLGDSFWVVAAAMNYDDVREPIAQNRIKTIEIFSMIVLTLACAVYIIMRTKKNKEALEYETRYLRELNNKNELLRKKDLQLQHSQKLQLIGTISGEIAHDFNNLLTPIRGYAEIMLSRIEPTEEIYDYVSEIYDASEKARLIIEEILLLSRLESGKVKKNAPVKVEEQVEEALGLIKSFLSPKVNAVFKKRVDSAVIFANKVQIHQVIMNLCNNAYQAMKTTGGELKIILDTIPLQEVKKIRENVLEVSDYVTLSVSDTGRGMSDDTLQKIFDPFFTTKPTGEGTGLGLYIVQSILEKHQGFITVDSELGKGSTFTVYLPRTEFVAKETEINKNPVFTEQKRILLVDDKQRVLKAMRRGLESYGFHVETESDSVEALQQFEKSPNHYDLVITDQAMPYLTGTELAERIKVINPSMKIILITGYVEDHVVAYKERLIIDEYMCKPVAGSDMAQMIYKVLQS